MSELVIITGANKGLGYQLSQLLLASSATCTVLSLSRNIADDQKILLSNKQNNRFHYIHHDFQTKGFTEKVGEIDAFLSKFKKIIFINNAASIQPLGLIGKLDGHIISDSINLNCTFPVLFIDHLIKCYANNHLTIIHISSGAYKRPILGWSIYSSCKAMLEMFINNLILESAENKKIKIFSIDPGTMDTNMQKEIRETESAQGLSTTDLFKELHTDGKLKNPADAAFEILKHCELI